jgi:beta-glucanase (GH16 family)
MRSRALYIAALAVCALAISSCGGGSGSCENVKKASGGEWVCSFDDEFSGDSLDRTRWRVTTTQTIGFTQAAGECYVDDPEHVSVADGLLTLRATKLASPVRCGTLTTPYESGMVFTKDLFAQAFGRFEIRAKMPKGPGFQPALWMYPQSHAYGDLSGEIDIAESFGGADTIAAHLHLHDATGADHPQGIDCHVERAADEFHTYTLEWVPGQFTFTYDGHLCWSVGNWFEAPPLRNPQPFDQPFFLLVQLGLGYGANAPGPTTHFPAELQLDYVRAWR